MRLGGQTVPTFHDTGREFYRTNRGLDLIATLSAPYLSQSTNHDRVLPHFPASFPAIQKSKSGQVLFTVFSFCDACLG